MENIEHTLSDTRCIIAELRKAGAHDVTYAGNTLQYCAVPGYFPTPYLLSSGGKTICYDHREYLYNPLVWTVTSVGPLLAGMVLSAVRPQDLRVHRGLELARFVAQLEDLFPHAAVDWCYQRVGRPGDYELRVYIDPLQDSYYEKVKQLFPVWSWGDWYICNGGYYFLSRDTPPCDMGAYLWVTSG